MAEKKTTDKEYGPATVLVVDDESSMRELLSILLENEGYRVLLASSGEEATEVFTREAQIIDLVIQDLKMPGMHGTQLLAWLKDKAPEVPVVVITAFSTWDNAVGAMRLGAYDYIRKPFDTDNIRAVVARAVDSRRLLGDGADGRAAGGDGRAEMIGNNLLIQELLHLIKRIAPTDSTVLVRGQSGTGKELVARAIHLRSQRRSENFVPVNCSAFTDSLLESELFGHAKGAFTGAVENRDGLFRAANGGTLFLDEVADMSLATQVKMLRVLEERKISPVGSTELIPIDVRIIAATNKCMEEEVQERRFREDLFYRLNVIPVQIPALCERKDDIPLLTGHFLAKYSKRLGKTVEGISDRALQSLNDYHWPGNVRELENIVQRHVALCEGNTIESIQLGTALRSRTAPTATREECGVPERLIPEAGVELEDLLLNFEKKYLREALRITDGNLTLAAKLLGMSYRSMRYRVKKLQVRGEQRVPGDLETVST
jgi:two-component system response regulator PilR (NtrC family)